MNDAPPSKAEPASAAPWSAAVLVAATYIFFLIFAQFGLLQGLHAAGHPVRTIHGVLGLMAAAGMTASLLAPRWIARAGAGRALGGGLAVCALAAGVGAASGGGTRAPVALLALISLLTGTGLGLATVALAADLRRLAGRVRAGVVAGLGTGAAYFVCNLPALFPASPTVKAATAAAVAAAGAFVAWHVRSAAAGQAAPAGDDLGELPARWFTAGGVALATIAFLALVGFDSAAFAVVQNEAALRARHWGTAADMWTNGTAHAAAAVAAGLLLGRGRLRTVLVAALALLVVGAWLFTRDDASGALASPAYASGVSAYSTALAAFAALGPAGPGRLAPAWRAAWVYALAGWLGSVAGVGLAEQAGQLPPWAAPAAALLLALALTPTLLRPAPAAAT